MGCGGCDAEDAMRKLFCKKVSTPSKNSLKNKWDNNSFDLLTHKNFVLFQEVFGPTFFQNENFSFLNDLTFLRGETL